MRFYEIGSLAVLDGREFVAIITERDIVRAAADQTDVARTAVRFSMTELERETAAGQRLP